MLSRKWLAVDMLVVTLCCALWMMLLTGAGNQPTPAPVDPAHDLGNAALSVALGAPGAERADPGSRAKPAPAPAAGELSLYLDTKTQATQTKPDDPAAVLKSGVTVARSPEALSHVPAAAATPADRSASLADRMQSRQASLSFGSNSSERLNAASDSTAVAVQPPAAADSAARVIDVTPVVTGHQPILHAISAPPAKPQPKPVAAKPVAAKPTLHAAAAKPLVAQPKPVLSAKASKPAPKATAQPLAAKAPAPEATSLREHFSAEELARGNDSVLLQPGEELVASAPKGQPDATETAEPSTPGVIATRPQPAPAKPTLAEALRGKSSAVGAEVPTIAPWRYVAGGIFLLALAFLAFWLKQGGAKSNPFKLMGSKALNVIETITLAPGRSIMLVELRGAALVLGVTPQSINLLERMPLEMLEGSYQPTVQQIITRESAARTADWAARPRFAAAGGGRPVAPALVPPLRRSYGPPPQGRMSVSELRQARATGERPAGFGELRVSSGPASGSNNRSKAELIDNLRRQLNQLER